MVKCRYSEKPKFKLKLAKSEDGHRGRGRGRAFLAKGITIESFCDVKELCSLGLGRPHLRPSWLLQLSCSSENKSRRFSIWVLFLNHVAGGILQWKQASDRVPPDTQTFISGHTERQPHNLLCPSDHPTGTLSEM